MPLRFASRSWCAALCSVWLCLAASAAHDKPASVEKLDERPIKIDAALPDYRPAGKLSGRLRANGSDTMNNLMSLWMEEFLKFYPDVHLEITGKGSGTAPPALLGSTIDIGTMARPYRASELEEFEKKYGYKPTALVTSFEMLGVIVHKDNPIQSLTLEQVDAVFSKTRKRGHQGITTWGDLGLKGEWTDKPIRLHGRNPASGTYGFFKEQVLRNGDFKNEVKEQPGNSSIVQAVGVERYGIGYAGPGWAIPQVRFVPLALATGKKAIRPKPEFAYSGEYPLVRPLYVVLYHKPRAEVDPLRREFVKFIFSKQGQTDAIKCGFVPVTATIAREQLEKVGLADSQKQKK